MASHRFAVFTLIAISLASGLGFMLDVISAYRFSFTGRAFGVPEFEKRFEALHKSMQAKTALGYVSDNVPNSTQAQLEFYLTQYVLAPVIVKASTEEPIVVANFHTNQPDPKLLNARHLTMVRDFGNDVFIFRNTTK